MLTAIHNGCLESNVYFKINLEVLNQNLVECMYIPQLPYTNTLTYTNCVFGSETARETDVLLPEGSNSVRVGTLKTIAAISHLCEFTKIFSMVGG